MSGMMIVAAHGIGVRTTLEQKPNQAEIALRHLVREQEVKNRLLVVVAPIGTIAGLEPVLHEQPQPLLHMRAEHGVV